MNSTTDRFAKARMSIGALMAAAAIAAIGVARAAHADAGGKCYNEMSAALITLALGQKCNYIDAATADKVKKAQDARLQCFQSKARAADRANVAKMVADAQATATKRAAEMQCAADTRKVYDTWVAKLTK